MMICLATDKIRVKYFLIGLKVYQSEILCNKVGMVQVERRRGTSYSVAGLVGMILSLWMSCP